MSLRPLPVPPDASGVYRFEGFTLDAGKACLYSGAEEVKLRPKPFEALRYMVERSGRLVSKDELTAAVWPDSFVSDNSLAQCFMEIRKALKDEDQRIIKTVPRRGYLFNVSVERVPGRAFQPVSAAVQAAPSIGVAQLIGARIRRPRFRWLTGLAALITILVAT